MEVRAELHASDYGVKKKELEDLETTIQLLAGNSRQWREIRADFLSGQKMKISAVISAIQPCNVWKMCWAGEVTSSNMEKLKKGIQAAMELIEEELADLNERIRETAKELKEKQEMVEDLKMTVSRIVRS